MVTISAFKIIKKLATLLKECRDLKDESRSKSQITVFIGVIIELFRQDGKIKAINFKLPMYPKITKNT
jgi:hypothetical protein